MLWYIWHLVDHRLGMVQVKIGLEPAVRTKTSPAEVQERQAIKDKLLQFSQRFEAEHSGPAPALTHCHATPNSQHHVFLHCRWEVQSCAGGSTDPACHLQASRALVVLVSNLQQQKGVTRRPEIRYVDACPHSSCMCVECVEHARLHVRMPQLLGSSSQCPGARAQAPCTSPTLLAPSCM